MNPFAKLWDKRFRLQRLYPLIARLPSGLAYWLATQIGHADAKFRRGVMSDELRVVADNVQKLLPDRAGARLDACLDAYACTMSRDKLDCFFMPRFGKEKPGEFIKVEGLEHLDQAKANGTGVVLIISHFGRFFMLGPALGLNGHPFGMLTTVVDERHPSYDPVDRWYMQHKLANTQMFSRDDWITTLDSHRRIFRTLGEGKVLLMALDGGETNSEKYVQFPFMGGTLTLPGGIVRVATATAAKLVYAAVYENADDFGVTVRIYPLPDAPLVAMAKAVEILEEDLKEMPWQWWMWPSLDHLWKAGAAHAH